MYQISHVTYEEVCPKGRRVLQSLNLLMHAVVLVGFSVIFLVFFICRLFIIVESGSWTPCTRIDVNICNEAARSLREVLSNNLLDDANQSFPGSQAEKEVRYT